MLLPGLAILFDLLFFRGIFVGKVPIPLDALVGVYHPWADFFWGFVAGVPYKNISLTDVFSQLYPWRILAMDTIRSWQLPLWNPYSFMGGPLLANWQSAPFFPLNLLMLAFGNVLGYGLMVAAQPLMAMIFMILFLRELKLSRTAVFIGAVSFAFGGFMMTYLEYSTTGQILAMIPLGLYLIEKYLSTQKGRYLLILVICEFFIFTGGFFQPAFYAMLVIGLYGLLTCMTSKSGLFSKQSFYLLLTMIFGAGLAAIQLIPTAELLALSIRNLDHNIEEYHYGLLPIMHLITLIAPDFFGNSATGNYFGFMQYQETSGYFGIAGLVLAVSFLFKRKKDLRQIFFCILFLVSLILAFESPISHSVFTFKLPLLSTGYASRWLMISTFAGAVLAAFSFDLTPKWMKTATGVIGLVTLGGFYLLTRSGKIEADPVQIGISLRNMILPAGVLLGTVILFIFPKKNIFLIALCILVSIDLFRYADKFTPMASTGYGTTTIPFIQRIRERAGIDRVAIDGGPLMPANTWIYGDIFTIGGYDPLLYKDSEVWFRAINVGVNTKQKIDGTFGNGSMTRYLNLDNPFSPFLDLAGVKYFLTLKKDKEGRFNENGNINGEFLKKYMQVDQFGGSVLMENKSAMPRINLFYEGSGETNDSKAVERLIGGFDFRTKVILKTDQVKKFSEDKTDSVALVSYTANKVVMSAETKNGAYLVLSDTDYPGWRATVNGKETKIMRADGIFRAVELPPGKVKIEFYYLPKSFLIGLLISGISLLAIAIVSFITAKKKTF